MPVLFRPRSHSTPPLPPPPQPTDPPAPPSHVDENAKASDENAYFGKENDKAEEEEKASDEESDEDEVGSGVLEVSDEDKGDVVARPASPASQIRKRVEPASPATPPATQLRKRVGFIICSQRNLETFATLTSPPMLASALGH